MRVLEIAGRRLRRIGGLGPLVGALLLGLLTLSWLTTTIGMANLAQGNGAGQGLGVRIVIGLGALGLVALMWVMLERARLAGPLASRLAGAACYAVLAAAVAGFGFSFWWGAIAARTETSRSLTASIATVDAELAAARARLTVLAEREGQAARAADVSQPRRGLCVLPDAADPKLMAAARRDIAGSARGAAAEIGSAWIPGIDRDLAELQQLARAAAAADAISAPGAREAALADVAGREQRLAVGTQSQLASRFRAASADLRAAAQPIGACAGPALVRSLAGVSAELAQPPTIAAPAWTYSEGSSAVEAALTRVWRGLIRPVATLSGPPAPADRLNARDGVALAASLAVDLGLLLLTLIRPPPVGRVFLGGARARGEARLQIERALARHPREATSLLYDQHFAFGAQSFVIVPDIVSRRSSGATPHGLHLAAAALSSVLGARRVARPSAELIAAAQTRLAELGWSGAAGEAASHRGGLSGALSRLIGRVRPGHPVIFAIASRDRDEAIRILDEQGSRLSDDVVRADLSPIPVAATTDAPAAEPDCISRSIACGEGAGVSLEEVFAAAASAPTRDFGRAPVEPTADQQAMTARIAAVRAAIERGLGEVERPTLEPPADDPPDSALAVLCARLGLSPFERDVLAMCAGVELDSAFASLCAAANGDARRTLPTFGLALATLADAHWSALSPAAPLRACRLVEVGPGQSLTAAPLRIDERILHYLLGVDAPDQRLHGLIRRAADPGALAPSHTRVANEVADALRGARTSGVLPAIHLNGEGGEVQHAIAAAACDRLGLRLQIARLAAAPVNPEALDDLIRLWRREAVLTGDALFLDADDPGRREPGAIEPVIARFADEAGAGSVLFIGSREPVCASERPTLRFDIPPPEGAEQRALWADALGGLGVDDAGGEIVESLAAHFRMTPRAMQAAGARALTNERIGFDAALWDACRVQSRTGLERLAQRLTPGVGWNDLILPEPQLATLHEIAAHLHHRTQVYEAWGLGAKGGRGLGVTALFSGPSGVGKTLAAEVLANALSLDLYKVDLSQVVNKYIGETEKNLDRVFRAAESSGAVLLFDEADALFGKRSDVKDSHDRYANIEVGFLLQRMESYRGLAILTTNMQSALDGAFLRRIRFIVRFPFPDHAHRRRIWASVFPEKTPTEPLDLDQLSRLNLSGGSIRNVALGAAFQAAAEGRPVRMEHIMAAAAGECAKIERPLAASELRGWKRRADLAAANEGVAKSG